jgi:serine/threonine protein phosphatase PrpC
LQSIFNNLFRKKNSLNPSPSESEINPGRTLSIDRETNKIVTEVPIQPAIATRLHLETPQIIVGVAHSVGIQRDKNEDSIFTLTTNLISSENTINFGLYIVADGMGGHENGELASSIAVEKLASHVVNTFYLQSISAKSDRINTSIQEVMQTGVMDAHQAIREKAIGGGTTLTAALILGDQMTIAHVGDSRAYTIDHDGDLKLLTHDHSLVKRLEEIGQLTPSEASIHPKRNLLYKALGQGELFEPDITSLQVCNGCELLLCSDGLWGVVPESNLISILRSSSEPQLVCQSLIQAANEAGGPDNISVIIVRFPE